MKKSYRKQIAIKTAKLISQVFGKKLFGYLILFFARVGQIDLLTFAYNRIGVLNSENNTVSGELFVIKIFLKEKLIEEKSIIFDVGANIGGYAEILYKEFPLSKIFAFEPTLSTYKFLEKKFLNSTVQTFNIGFGAEKKTNQKIYSYSHDDGSPHNSVFDEVFTELYKTGTPKEMNFNCTTIDHFCHENNIHSIDFLKIDTEGNEFDILNGASKMLKENRIKFIQFEFNEMNIISKVFLRDFYNLLKQYKLYRLSEKKLISLETYSSTNEIFKFQNILAVNNNLSN
ncbi:MAG: FkbM family methyltransferase [Candidatus Pacebacteria bacterium]|nr:FkbM family methyltransferase [Candidatus Paceibacterota bacterium]